jgi:hypothetical protein
MIYFEIIVNPIRWSVNYRSLEFGVASFQWEKGELGVCYLLPDYGVQPKSPSLTRSGIQVGKLWLSASFYMVLRKPVPSLASIRLAGSLTMA